MAEKSKGTILIVDDEPNVVWFISQTCQPRGYQTLTAGSGTEALKLIQECGEKLDLVLLDLKMPGMGGVEVLKAIRKFHPELAVIILTGATDQQKECEALGIEAFLKKPYSLEDLYEKMEAVMSRKAFDSQELKLEPGTELVARILIVDDDSEVCEVLSAALFEDISDACFDVKWCQSGDQALTISKEFKPDIALIDIKMPRMWGDELVARFKAGEGFCPRDFVIYTALNEPIELERARKSGHKYLTKPTDLDTLFEVLKKICVKHNLLRKKG